MGINTVSQKILLEVNFHGTPSNFLGKGWDASLIVPELLPTIPGDAMM